MIIKLLKRSTAGKILRYVRSVYYRTILKEALYVAKPQDAVQISKFSNGDNPTFFGYHDKTPFNLSGDKILATSVQCNDTDPQAEGTEMKVGYFKFNGGGEVENKFIPLSDTRTWCWQQGCMLQWNPTQPDREIIYNTFVNDQYGSVFFDIVEKKTVKKLTNPVYSVSPANEEAVTLNFSRLGRLRPGYGYCQLPDSTENENAPDNDGLFLMNFKNDKKKLLVSLEELAGQVDAENRAQHYINHATFAPDGNKISFFHLWSLPNDKNRNLRFLIFNIKNSTLSVIEDERMVSHYCWRNSKELLVTTRSNDGVWQYVLYNINDNNRKHINIPIKVDGHPMFSPVDSSIFITDTYPDKRNDQHLCLVNLQTGTVDEIMAYYSPFRYTGQVRCDLHPRWDRTGRSVVVDTTKNSPRKMILVNVNGV